MTFSSAVATAVAVIVRNQHYFDVVALALLSFMLFMPLSFLGSKLDLLLRLCIGKLSIPAEQAIAQRDSPKIALLFITSLVLGFAICMVAQVPIIILGTIVLRHIIEIWPENLNEALKFSYFTIPAIGSLDMLAGNFEKSSLALFLIGFVSTICCYMFL